jgi:taurine dioxygenase
LEVLQVAGALGATVSGIDLRKVTRSDELDGVRQALADHLVVFLPEQDIDLDDLERITDLLGGRDTTPYVTALKDRPYVIRVIKEPGDLLNFANAWHSDLSYLPTPPSYTLLHAWEVPAFGETRSGPTSTWPTRPCPAASGRHWPDSEPCTQPGWPTGPEGSSTR